MKAGPKPVVSLCATAVFLAILTTCMSGCRHMPWHSHDWYSGPSEYKEPMRDAINTALAELPRELGRPLKWDWNRDRVRLQIREPDGHMHGLPILHVQGQTAYGFTGGNNITLPRGFGWGTFRHEAGHVVMNANGFPQSMHHDLAPGFFRRHSGR